MTHGAVLALEDGTVFWGRSIGVNGESIGEVVFNTAMTGYQEILTDPSYARQIVTLTYAHIGNTGTNPDDYESVAVQGAGLIIRDLPQRASNYRSTHSLQEFLQEERVVAISDIDTRKLTRLLRHKGALRGCIVSGEAVDASIALARARDFAGLKGMDLARDVSVGEAYRWQGGGLDFASGYRSADRTDYKVVAYDFGIKRNILRLLVDRGCDVQVVPATTPAEKVLAMSPHGIFLSNGPGDPEPCTYAITAIQDILKTDIPVFGICLGHQLLALACGAKTEKMKFGHPRRQSPGKGFAKWAGYDYQPESRLYRGAKKICRQTCMLPIAVCLTIRFRASR